MGNKWIQFPSSSHTQVSFRITPGGSTPKQAQPDNFSVIKNASVHQSAHPQSSIINGENRQPITTNTTENLPQSLAFLRASVAEATGSVSDWKSILIHAHAAKISCKRIKVLARNLSNRDCPKWFRMLGIQVKSTVKV